MPNFAVIDATMVLVFWATASMAMVWSLAAANPSMKVHELVSKGLIWPATLYNILRKN